MQTGDLNTAKVILRDYTKAIVGFEQLGVEVGSSANSLICMLGRAGELQARNLFRLCT